MAHYFEEGENSEDILSPFSFEINGRKFELDSAQTLFSFEKLDTGTRLLLESVLENQEPCSSLLDLGCGSGVVGIVLQSFWHCQAEYIDVNPRACRICSQNLEKLGLKGTVLCQSGITEGKFDCILLNPPIHAGKEAVYQLFKDGCEHLAKEGSFWIVIRKSHGAASAVKYLESLHMRVERISRDKGFWILKIQNQA